MVFLVMPFIQDQHSFKDRSLQNLQLLMILQNHFFALVIKSLHTALHIFLICTERNNYYAFYDAYENSL